MRCYTKDMTKKASRNPAQKRVQQSASWTTLRVIRLILAGYVLVLVLAQLFSFDKFPGLLSSVGVGATATAAAIVLVVAEVGALPLLLGMEVPRWVRRASIISGVVALLLMTALEVMAAQHGATMLFGATFDLPGGSWSLVFLAGIWILAVWASGVGQATRRR